MKDKDFFKVMGKAIMYASIQAVFASIEISTKVAMVSVSRDQVTLQKCADSLTHYIVMAIFWTIGSVSLLYSGHGMIGFWWGLIANLVVVLWLIFNYLNIFKKACEKYNLTYPKLFDLI